MKKAIWTLIFTLIGININGQSIEAFVSSSNKYNTDVWIEKIIIGAENTEVKMMIKPDQSDIEIYLYPPQSERSVILRTFEKTYQLLSADSIPFYPQTTTVHLNESKTFSLFYDKIPDYVTEVDVIERVEPFDSGFSFFNVKLSKEKERKVSLRFGNKTDFEEYFLNKKPLHPMEGFWEVKKQIFTSYKKKKREPKEEEIQEIVAVVKEDGLLRAYLLNGEEFGIAIKELDNYFALHSEMIESSILLEVTKNRKGIKLFGLLDKNVIYPKRKERKKVDEIIVQTYWKKQNQ